MGQETIMAETTGKAGRYVTAQAVKKLQNQVLIMFSFFYLCAFGLGYCLDRSEGLTLILLIPIIIVAGLAVMYRLTGNIERDRLNYRKGAVGEAAIGSVLESFPDGFRVIHDIATGYGNIDHVVICSTGVYVIDTKNWRGVVTADGNGELLLNGEPTDKPAVKNLTRAIMSAKETIRAHAGFDTYVIGILAFPSAYVDVKWGTTGTILCMRDEQLYDYIVEGNNGSKLSKQQLHSIYDAFLRIADLDKDFRERAGFPIREGMTPYCHIDPFTSRHSERM